MNKKMGSLQKEKKPALKKSLSHKTFYARNSHLSVVN